MTEYRLVPVKPTPEMIEAACTFETWGWGFTRELDREAAAATYAAMLAAAPPAPTREEVRAQIIETIERIVDSDYDGNLYYVEECADAILSLLGMQPSPPHHKGLSI